MKTNPKSLGNTWEREFCRDLSLWWTKGKDAKVFWRTDSSGAVKGVSELAGDVKAIKEIGYPLIDNIIIELKRTKDKDLLIDMVRRGDDSKIGKWWVKLCKEAEEWRREPFLVIKLVNRTVICLTLEQYFGDVPHILEYNGIAIALWEDIKKC